MIQISLEEVEKVLDEKIRPGLALHGGDIQIAGQEGGVLRVRLLGQCSGCPSAIYTMEDLVQEELLQAFPQLSSVELVTDVSEDLIKQARQILSQRRRS